MGRNQGEGLIIFHTDAPCITEASGVWGIEPTTLITEAHKLFVKKINSIVSLSIYTSISLIIYLLLLLRFISPILLVTALVPSLDSYSSTLALLHIDGLLLVFWNILLIFLVRTTTKTMVRCIKIGTRIKTCDRNIECTRCAQGVIGSVRSFNYALGFH